jgi:hypothetical protein
MIATARVDIIEEVDRGYLRLDLPDELRTVDTRRVTTAILGEARVAGLAYENADRSPLTVDRDYLGQPRASAPAPGPFEDLGQKRVRVW